MACTARLRCLIVEDQALIALSLEAYLEEDGFDIGQPAASCAEALRILEHHTPDLAIIDFKLKDGPATELAHELRRRGVPFIVYSGMPREAGLPPEFDDVPWLEKPATRADLLRALRACRARDGATGATPA